MECYYHREHFDEEGKCDRRHTLAQAKDGDEEDDVMMKMAL